ncbi:MAG: transketolase, partial [Desulfococcaceae bacterium]|nr:transketolase [Desulfococcaceae bacterium]
NFRQWGSRTPGHPEYGHTPGVETTTGPLGQGVANAVGMAMAERHLAARFNREGHEIVDHYTYVMCGDGDLMEGVAYEAVSLAGHLGLGKLICMYDDNEISIEGSTDITFTENVGLRFEACNWQVQKVADGNDIDALLKALEAAKAETEKPSLIIVQTQIAYGSPNKQGKSSAHGEPLGDEEIRLTKKNLGCPEDECFCVPEESMNRCRNCAEIGREAEMQWQKKFTVYAEAHPELAAEWKRLMSGELPKDWDAEIPAFSPEEKPIATRSASGKVLNAIAAKVPELMGGSADLAPSNKTWLSSAPVFQKNAYEGRNFHFGVREHAMGAVMNGMILHKGIRPYGGTFLVFADYMRSTLRLAALMKLPVIYVFTHDSVAVGEDGPTHQPVEHAASLRAIPGLTVLRPADATETAQAWRVALESKDSPTALLLSRQNLPVLDRKKYAPAENLSKGGYVLSDCEGTPDIILISTGAEVHVTMSAAEELSAKGIKARMVSMPSWELFEKTDATYKESVLPKDVKIRVAVEAGIPMGWEKFTGRSDAVIGIDHFGASAPGGLLLEKFGFTKENIVNRAMKLLEEK